MKEEARMKRIFIILIVTVMLLLAVLVFSFETSKTLTLPAGEIRQLRVDSGAGRLKVTGVDSLTRIEVTAEIYARGESEENMADFIKDRVELSLEKRGDRAVLISEIEGHSRLFFSGDAGINLTVRVPRSLALEIEDGSGDMTVEDIAADVSIGDGSGAIRVERVAGDLRIDDNSGELEIENVGGDVSIDDGSGSITIADVKGSVTVDDGSGSIDIDRIGKDVIIEESGSGGVHIGKVDGRVIRHDRDDDDDEDDDHD
jgi:hypothetical protein